MILGPDFEARTVEQVRRWTDDIEECSMALISVVTYGGVPSVEFIFNDQTPVAREAKAAGLRGSPLLNVQMVAESRNNPMKPGRLLASDELKRHVRTSIETYFKLNGLEITRKAFLHAHV